MRNTFHLMFRNFVRDDGQPFIQLHRIAVDNFAIKSTSYLDGQLPAVMSSEWSKFKERTHIGLARSRRAHNSYQWLSRGRSHACGKEAVDGAQHASSLIQK
jgi:hypothetical protein